MLIIDKRDDQGTSVLNSLTWYMNSEYMILYGKETNMIKIRLVNSQI